MKSTLVAVYVYPSFVPTMAPLDLVVSFPLRKCAFCDGAAIHVQLVLGVHHVELRAGLERGPTRVDCAHNAGSYAKILLHVSATCALCSSTPKATREYDVR